LFYFHRLGAQENTLKEFMKNFQLIYLIALLLIVGCSGNREKNLATLKDEKLTIEAQDEEAYALYSKALEDVAANRYKAAIESFEEIERLYPFSKFSINATRMVAFCHFERRDYDKAIEVLDKFISQNPGNKYISYIYYLKALSYYNQISDVKRDSVVAKNALDGFDEVMTRFPKTDYAKDSKYKKDLVLNTLAGKEMEVGRFYLKRKNFVSAINRFQNVVRDYQNTSQIEEALYRLVEANASLGIQKEAIKNAAILGYNYPDSKWYALAYKVIKNSDNDPGKEERKTIQDYCKLAGVKC